MKEPSSKSLSGKLLTILGSFSGIVLILVAAAIGKVAGRQGAKVLLDRNPASVAPAHYAGAQWERRTFQDISLSTPFELDVDPEFNTRIPQSMRDSIEYFEMYRNLGGGTVNVAVSRLAYKPHVEVSLDGGVHGAMTQAAAAMGASNPQYSSSPTNISGLEARKASYRGTIAEKTIQIEAVFVRRGQQLWQIQVLCLSSSSAGDASRILESITILP